MKKYSNRILFHDKNKKNKEIKEYNFAIFLFDEKNIQIDYIRLFR